MDPTDTMDLPLRLLDWYREMGVDAAVGDEAIDWLARGAVKPGSEFALPTRTTESATARATPPPREQSAGPPALSPMPKTAQRAPIVASTVAPRSFAGTAPEAAVAAARAAANGAGTIEALGQALAKFDGCGLKATAKNLCFYRGAAEARLMIVGEAPVREDDLAGTPFSGPAGELLEKMLAAIDLKSGDCHVTNAVYWRPPGNRHPTPQELDVCQPFLERQIVLVKPEIVLLLGAAAARQVMDVTDGIMRVRGRWRDMTIGGHTVRAMASLSPTYLIKAPSSKQNAWRDLLAIKEALSATQAPLR